MFALVAPNGWTLGWDAERHFASFQRAVAPEMAHNRTSFDERYCNSFTVTLDRPGGGEWLLTTDLSFVADAASLHWTEYVGRGGRVVDTPSDPRAARLMNAAHSWLTRLGYLDLTGEEQELPVRVTTLGLCEGTPTLGRCLFVDHA